DIAGYCQGCNHDSLMAGQSEQIQMCRTIECPCVNDCLAGPAKQPPLAGTTVAWDELAIVSSGVTGRRHRDGDDRSSDSTHCTSTLHTIIAVVMLLSAASTPPNCTFTAAVLEVMLEKEQYSPYRRCPPNPNVPLAEYIQDRPLLINWCCSVAGQCNFRSPSELVQTAMALADKYMSDRHLQIYTKAHYQLIVVTCLNIAMKTDSPAKAPSHKELSEICRGAYTPEEIESEEMCILRVLEWYVNPPTASQAANHILETIVDSSGVGHEWDLLVDRVHQLIGASVLDMGLSMLRPSTVAMAALIVSAKTFSQDFRRRIFRAAFSVMNMPNFGSACDVDSTQTKLYYILDKNYAASPPDQSTDRRQVHGRHEIEDLIEANRLSRRERLGGGSKANASKDNGDMEVSEEELRSLMPSSSCSSSTCTTLETIYETEPLQLFA
ncbi:hypothetical protein THAOC_18596, partial [Thalassiosira oceanica]